MHGTQKHVSITNSNLCIIFQNGNHLIRKGLIRRNGFMHRTVKSIVSQGRLKVLIK